MRLYGPYGISDVAGVLTSLAIEWDDEAAKALFWEELHHQDTLYPVSYAALPWIWKIASEHDQDTCLEAYFFLSHFVACALSSNQNLDRYAESAEKYNGLSLARSEHAKDWLPEETRLTQADMTVLGQLEKWVDKHIEEIALSCVGVGATFKQCEAVELYTGHVRLHSTDNFANALGLWAIDMDHEDIFGIFGPKTDGDHQSAENLRRFVHPENKQLQMFLRRYATGRIQEYYSDEDDQLKLPLDDYVKVIHQEGNERQLPDSDRRQLMSLEQLTEGVREKVASGGIEESVKFDMGGDGVIFLQGSDVSNDDGDADCTIKISAEDLADLLSGELNPTSAFMGGKMQVEGDMSVAMKLGSIV
ncbi:putative sterol carrier protein [Labrenzia sp. EL_195]|nr:putative sterol carrier protein [Labrenzia sp. EL_195]